MLRVWDVRFRSKVLGVEGAEIKVFLTAELLVSLLSLFSKPYGSLPT